MFFSNYLHKKVQKLKNKDMAYFNYHSQVKKKIKETKIVELKFLKTYNNISPCLLICFSDGKQLPIREDKWFEYLSLISELNNNLKELISVNEVGIKLQ